MNKTKILATALTLGLVFTLFSYLAQASDGLKLVCDDRLTTQEVRGFPRAYYNEVIPEDCIAGTFNWHKFSGSFDAKNFLFDLVFWSVLSAGGVLVFNKLRKRK